MSRRTASVLDVNRANAERLPDGDERVEVSSAEFAAVGRELDRPARVVPPLLAAAQRVASRRHANA